MATVTKINYSAKLQDAFYPKRAGTNHRQSHVLFILDDSGSMQPVRNATISGFNEFLSAQKINAINTGIETFVSLYKFDGSSVNCVYEHINAQSAPLLTHDTYNPNGGTNLLDAMGAVMMKINSLLATQTTTESIIVVTLTDGEENSSRTFNNEAIRNMVSKAEDGNWGFMFLGANINAFAVGGNLGFNVNNTVQYTARNIGDTIATASRMANDMKMGYSQGLNSNEVYFANGFTEAERTAAVSND